MKRHSAADGLGFAEGSYIRKTIMIYYILLLFYFIFIIYFIIFNYLYFNYKYKIWNMNNIRPDLTSRMYYSVCFFNR